MSSSRSEGLLSASIRRMNGLAFTRAAASSCVTASFWTPGGRCRFVIDAFDQTPPRSGRPSGVLGIDVFAPYAVAAHSASALSHTALTECLELIHPPARRCYGLALCGQG